MKQFSVFSQSYVTEVCNYTHTHTHTNKGGEVEDSRIVAHCIQYLCVDIRMLDYEEQSGADKHLCVQIYTDRQRWTDRQTTTEM